MTGRSLAALALAALCAGAVASAGERCVTDDAGREVCLAEPAQRVVSLSPGATELLFAAGAGERVVGTVSHSDYPEAAEAIPRVGSYKRIDMEGLVERQPDLVVAWSSGNPPEQLERLEELGPTVYRAEPRTFEDVATTLERLGVLTATDATADAAAADFREAIDAIRERYSDREPVRVFYQVWPDPLMTVNDDHLISQAAALCSGENVFGDQNSLTPRIDRESVLARDPEVIVAGGMGEADDSWLDAWRGFDDLQAVQHDNLFFVPPSTLQRPTPRLVEGTRALCQRLDTARERR
ncbi:MAG: cobalamin-binding protein [Ectothiorhodospiraceae bacterium]